MRGRDICLVKTGVGRKNAAAAARAICEYQRPGLVIIAGAAGALDPALRRGSVVVAERVILENGAEQISCPPEWAGRALAALRASGMQAQAGSCCQARTFIQRSSDKQDVRAKTRAHVVDMESFALASEFQRAGVPFVNIRVVSDAALRDTADMETLARLRLRRGRWPAALYLCRRPRELVRALSFYRGMNAASQKIAEAVSAVVCADTAGCRRCSFVSGEAETRSRARQAAPYLIRLPMREKRKFLKKLSHDQ
jgi:hypothetical protein